jgi:hypothetical protein
MQAILQRKYHTKWFVLNKVCITYNVFENEFQNIIL